jgi:hypothetical protein
MYLSSDLTLGHMNYFRTNKTNMVFFVFSTHLTPNLYSKNGHVFSPYQFILYWCYFLKKWNKKIKIVKMNWILIFSIVKKNLNKKKWLDFYTWFK